MIQLTRSGMRHLLVYLVCSLISASAQNECPSPWNPISYSRDSSNIRHQTLCVHPVTGQLKAPWLSLQDAGGQVYNISAYGAIADSTTDNSVAIQSAISTAVNATGGGTVFVPAGTYGIKGSINLPAGVELVGAGKAVSQIKSLAGYVGTKMITASANHATVAIRNLLIDAANLPIGGTVIDLTRSPEGSIRDVVDNVWVINAPTNSTMLVMDGDEDSVIANTHLIAGGSSTGVIAIKWHVPGGNGHIYGLVTFSDIYISYQSFDITGSTTGGIICDGVCSALSLNGVYGYASLTGGNKGNLKTTATNAFGGINITGSYFNPNGDLTSIGFIGTYSDTVMISSTYFQGAYFVLGAATVALTGYQPSFIFTNWQSLTGSSIGTPGTGIKTSVIYPKNALGLAEIVSTIPTIQPSNSRRINIGSGGPFNNLDISNYEYVEFVGPVAAYTVTGFLGGIPGRRLMLLGAVGFSMTLSHLNALSSVGNRIYSPTNADVVIGGAGGASAILQYSGDIGAWVILSKFP